MQSATSKNLLNPSFFTGKRNFCLVMIVNPDAQSRNIIDVCKQEAHPIMKSCTQQEGTYHFTLFANQPLSYDEAMEMSYRHTCDDVAKSIELPTMKLNGFLPWNHCVALDSDTDIDQVINCIESQVIPPLKKPDHLHMTLYRMTVNWNKKGAREHKQKLMKVFASLKSNVINRCDDFGSAKCSRLVLKEMGADYFGRDQSLGSFFRIL